MDSTGLDGSIVVEIGICDLEFEGPTEWGVGFYYGDNADYNKVSYVGNANDISWPAAQMTALHKALAQIEVITDSNLFINEVKVLTDLIFLDAVFAKGTELDTLAGPWFRDGFTDQICQLYNKITAAWHMLHLKGVEVSLWLQAGAENAWHMTHEALMEELRPT